MRTGLHSEVTAGFKRVGLSFDTEKSWQEATIVDPAMKISWSLWNYRVNYTETNHSLAVVDSTLE